MCKIEDSNLSSNDQMHKGRTYELEPRARVFSGPSPYPLWPAKTYTISVASWAVNTIGAPTPHDFDNVVFIYIDPTVPVMFYKGFLNVGGHAVEPAFFAYINAAGDDADIFFDLFVDGVSQKNAPVRWDTIEDWSNIVGEPINEVPSGTAVLFPDLFSVDLRANPY